MSISAAQAAQLNTMCQMAQETGIGTEIKRIGEELAVVEGLAVKAGSYTVIAADDTANTKTIATGLGKAITGYMVNIFRSGVQLAAVPTVTKSSANLTIADNAASYVLTTGDVINYMVF